MGTSSSVPFTSADFDKAYKAPITFWGDVRIPKELKEIIRILNPLSSLEFGCGLGRYTNFMAEQGVDAFGVDFSPVAIEKARDRIKNKSIKPTFLVDDVTNLKTIKRKFDFAFDIGCFHCLNQENGKKYITEAYRLLEPGATLLIWAMDTSPSNINFGPSYISDQFGEKFHLVNSKFSRRRIVASHWYWLERI